MSRPVLPALLIIGGGILSLLGGLVLVGTGVGDPTVGAATGGATIVVGFLIAFAPSQKNWLAFAALALAVLSIFYSLAGFVVGFFLVILGGVMAYVWVPPSPAAPTSPRTSP
ncbi:MAG: DUF6114 domain-containing protein [Thermoplasmata archaeon]